MPIDFRHDQAAHEYVAVGDGGRAVGKIVYHDDAAVRVFEHTETAEELQGQGLAGRLTRFALDDTRSAGLAVDPACPYTRNFIERHPEYSDIAM